ncbi:uncharacterized protein LOC105849188 isoform X1 [Hydra vulgaris]|uniref:uncharacterized protein LOC105849188 isoform X1 n=1 Tax=Hydra vulgaris TaxID=6087 RepID=UPI001F5FB51B|nr:uncharacterized protein LOC105849188 [Hydra vulgaris]
MGLTAQTSLTTFASFSLLLVVTIIPAVPFVSCVSWGTWSDGFYMNYGPAVSIATNTQLCGKYCFQKIIDGELFVGAIFGKFCFCLIKSLGFTFQPSTTFKYLQFKFSYIDSYKSVCQIGETLMFNVRMRFYSEGNDKSIVYFIDNLNEPLTKSGRIYNIDSINYGRSTYDSRVLGKYNETNQANSLEEYYGSGGVDTEIENLYTLVTKVGDMSAETKQTEWAVLIVSSNKRLQYTLTPFIVLRPPMNCSLLISTSSMLKNDRFYVNFTLTTSVNCTADLKNIYLLLHPEKRFIYRGIIWDKTTSRASLIMPTSVIVNEKYISIYLSHLRIDTTLKFSATFDNNVTTAVTGTTNLTVLATLVFCEYVNNVTVNKSRTFIFKRPLRQIKQEITTFSLKSDINVTSFETTTHLFYCQPIQKRQQTACYQKEKRNRFITYLPIQFLEVIGYNPITKYVYGKTFHDHIVELDFNRKIPAGIISSDKWNKIKSDINFQLKNK